MASLIPFIARLADQAPHLVTHTGPVSDAALEMFRRSTRQHVLTGLKLIRRRKKLLELAGNTHESESIWSDLQYDCQALFLAEMLGRVWGAILEGRSQSRNTDLVLKNLARYVLLQHLELRREILNLMNRWCSEAYPQVAALDFQYRRMERWTDVLLGPLVEKYGLGDFVFDVNRSREYALENCSSGRHRYPGEGRIPRKLAIDSFLASYRTVLFDHSLLRDHQAAIIRSILGMLPDDPFFAEQRYLLGRIWAEQELNPWRAARGIKMTGA